ncbi:MAG: hypothetical protein GF416_01585 [Candidatus Altiarchaeales archaeon]|nr:hypothetical protein [Candidatus Altiarchaeales archaeon]MBD3415807.1 hypothetical protein [Candidatus Altiarchaeales archaeon]
MVGAGVKRLRQGRSLLAIIRYLIRAHPEGLKRSDIQARLKEELNVGESVGGVNRQLKKLRDSALISWNQSTYTYTLPPDYDSKEYFIRISETMGMTTDQAYFLSLDIKNILSPKTMTDIDDYLGFRYDTEMAENMTNLHSEYKMDEVIVHDLISKMMKHHNSYVRLRLFKTANECFINDLIGQPDPTTIMPLIKSYTRNKDSIDDEMRREKNRIFSTREDLIKQLKEKRLSRKMKFLIRFALNHVRPALVYDSWI